MKMASQNRRCEIRRGRREPTTALCVNGVFFGLSSGADAMPAALLPDMLAEKLMRFRIENADVKRIPLDVDELSDPAWRNAVIGRVDFDASVQMHDAFAVLVITERLQRQWKQERFFFGEHRRHLPLRRAVNARIGPARFPLIQIRLSLFQAFEAHSFQRRFLRVADTGFHFPFAIGISNRHGMATTP